MGNFHEKASTPYLEISWSNGRVIYCTQWFQWFWRKNPSAGAPASHPFLREVSFPLPCLIKVFDFKGETWPKSSLQSSCARASYTSALLMTEGSILSTILSFGKNTCGRRADLPVSLSKALFLKVHEFKTIFGCGFQTSARVGNQLDKMWNVLFWNWHIQ